MNDFAVETNINTASNLDSLEKSLATLIENHQLLKLENEQLKKDLTSARKTNDMLVEKHERIEARVSSLLNKLVNIETE